jgi:hypothetical protein
MSERLYYIFPQGMDELMNVPAYMALIFKINLRKWSALIK